MKTTGEMKLETTEEALRNALAWYGEQARLARLVHSEGDPGRWALAEDGGKRAREVLAMSASPAGVVKPLEWRKLYEGSNAWPMTWHGTGIFGKIYPVEQHSPNQPFYTLGKGYDTLEAAKSAAFADYSARIMSVIEPAGVGVETPPPSTHVAVAEAAKRYLAAIDSDPENDIWDTWDGKPAEGALKTASDASWADHGQKIEARLSELRAALATTEGK